MPPCYYQATTHRIRQRICSKFFKNILQVAFGQTIARYPPLCRFSKACSTVGTVTRFDPPVGLEVITNWPQNRSISLGLARKRVFVFVSSCNPSCDLFLILCLFLSLCFAILLLLRFSHHSPIFGLGRCLVLAPGSCPDCHHVLAWK